MAYLVTCYVSVLLCSDLIEYADADFEQENVNYSLRNDAQLPNIS